MSTLFFNLMSCMHVIVVGTGIVGTSLAYHLAREKARVTLIGQADHITNGVTGKSFGWITVSPNAPEAYSALRQQAIADWHRLDKELNGYLCVDWSGALRWWEDPIDTESVAGRMVRFGYPVQLIDQQQVRLLEPNLKSVPSLAIFAEHEGAINAKLATDLLTQSLREAGASIQPGNPALSLMTDGSRITGVVTAAGKLLADRVVLATGIATNTLCQPLGVRLPINESPAALLTFEHTHQFVNRIVSSPLVEMRPVSSRLTLAAEECVEEPTENYVQALGRSSLEKIRQSWQGADSVRIHSVVIGKRAIPQDGLPLIGRIYPLEGLYIAVMHAGVTLASVVGRLAASEILNDEENDLLAPYKPLRFH